MKRKMPIVKDMTVLLKGYTHKWVALNEAMDKVVASGKSVAEVLEQARAAGVKEPVLTRAPSNSKNNKIYSLIEAYVERIIHESRKTQNK